METIDKLKSLLKKEDNLYYGKSTIQNMIRTDPYFTEQNIIELSKKLKDKLTQLKSQPHNTTQPHKYTNENESESECEYLDMILGVLCGERVRIQNLCTTNSLLGEEHSGNTNILNMLLYKEYQKYLRYPDVDENTKQKLYKNWLTILSGSLNHVKIVKEEKETIIYYSDHVTRMQKEIYSKEEELQKFTIPQFENDDFVLLNIDDISKEYDLSNTIIPNELKRELKPFNYENLENYDEGCKPVVLDMEFENFNDEQITMSCLHMPIKISKSFADNFNNEGRRDPNGNVYDHNCLYIPKEFAKKDLLDLLKYSTAMECKINRERLDTNFILLTFRTEKLKQNTSLGKTGWHIDGHQGVERIQKDGQKVAIDRVYCVSNTLPTQYSDIRLDLSPIRDLAKSEILTLDQYNIQSIIQQTVQKAEKDTIKIVHEAPANKVFYANPYVIHQSQVNTSEIPTERHFARVLFSVDERDRIGDTVSPIFGPIYPFKIKQIIDIKQPPQNIDFYKYKINSN